MVFLHVCLALLSVASAALYDISKSSIFLLNSSNFERQVTKNRDRFVSIVHFFRQYDGKSKKVAEEFVKLSEEWQGVYVVAAVDCDIYEGLCEKEDVRETPKIKLYPPFPAPITTYEGEITAKDISAFASRYINGNVVELGNDNYKAWLDDKPSVPKVVLFTEKKGIPTIFKALSVSFQVRFM
jgi:thioredoxin-like negative regulator of GroEL